MKNLVIILCIITILITMLDARIKIGIVSIDILSTPDSLVSYISEIFSRDSTVDLIIGPDCGLGGYRNKGRIRFTHRGDTILYAAYDTSYFSERVVWAIDSLRKIAKRFKATIVAGPVWEIDTFYRLVQTIPIIDTSGLIKRLRRKVRKGIHYSVIDSTIRIDTLYTHDSSMYTLFLTISNECYDIPRLYRAFSSADIWAILNWHMIKNTDSLISNLNFSESPDSDLADSLFPEFLYDSLIGTGWISDSTVVVVASCGDFSGAFWLKRAVTLDSNWLMPDYKIYGNNSIINIDPFAADSAGRINVSVMDTVGTPIPYVHIHVEGPYGFEAEGLTDLTGWTSIKVLYYGSYRIMAEAYGGVVVPEDTLIEVNSDSPVCTVSLTFIDTTKIVEHTESRDTKYYVIINPYQGFVFKDFPKSAKRLSIYDITGRFIDCVNLQGKNFAWEPKKYITNGIYFVCVDGEIIAKVLILK